MTSGLEGVDLVRDSFRHFPRLSTVQEDPKHITLEDTDFVVYADLS